LKYIILGIIIAYQKLFSPDHSWLRFFWPYGYCRFQPSCSEYAFDAVEKFGAVKGSVLGAVRIANCNPFSQPGYRPLKNTSGNPL